MGGSNSVLSDSSSKKRYRSSNNQFNIDLCKRWKLFINKYKYDEKNVEDWQWLLKIKESLKVPQKNNNFCFQQEMFHLSKERYFESDKSMQQNDTPLEKTQRDLLVTNQAELLISENKKPIKMCHNANCNVHGEETVGGSGIIKIENEFLKCEDQVQVDDLDDIYMNYIKYTVKPTCTQKLEATILSRIFKVQKFHLTKKSCIINKIIRIFISDITGSLQNKMEEISINQKVDSSKECIFMATRMTDCLRRMLRQLSYRIQIFSNFMAQFIILFYNFDQIEFHGLLDVGGSLVKIKNSLLNADIFSNFVINVLIDDIIYSNLIECFTTRYDLEQKRFKQNYIKKRNITTDDQPIPASFKLTLGFLKNQINDGYQVDQSKMKTKLKKNCSFVKNCFPNNSMTTFIGNGRNNESTNLKLFLGAGLANSFHSTTTNKGLTKNDVILASLSLSNVYSPEKANPKKIINSCTKESYCNNGIMDNLIINNAYYSNSGLHSNSTNDSEIDYMHILYDMENVQPFSNSIDNLRRIIIAKSPLAKLNVLQLTVKTIIQEIKEFHSQLYNDGVKVLKLNNEILGYILKFVILKSNVCNWFVQLKYTRAMLCNKNMENDRSDDKLVDNLLFLYESVIKHLSCDNIDNSKTNCKDELFNIHEGGFLINDYFGIDSDNMNKDRTDIDNMSKDRIDMSNMFAALKKCDQDEVSINLLNNHDIRDFPIKQFEFQPIEKQSINLILDKNDNLRIS